MGIVPDVKAIQLVAAKIKHKKATKTTADLSRYKPQTSVVSEVIQSKVQRDIFDDFIKEDLHRYVDIVARDNTHGLIISDTTQEDIAPLVNQFEKKNVKGAIEDLGPSKGLVIEHLQKLKSQQEQANLSIKEQNQAVDSDGDLDTDPKQIQKEIIYRDQDGFRITKDKWLELQNQNKKFKVVKKPKPATHETIEWGKGIVQEKEQADIEERDRRIASEPLSNYELDPQTDLEYRQQLRWEDPLLKMQGYNNKSPKSSKKNKNKHPKCKFPTPPNRFMIEAGYRWDGVIRGNGYEEKYLKARNKKLHQNTEQAYKWSVADL